MKATAKAATVAEAMSARAMALVERKAEMTMAAVVTMVKVKVKVSGPRGEEDAEAAKVVELGRRG